MKWAKAPAPRDQILLFRESLDDVVGADHPIRCLEAILRQLDWSHWEARYDGYRGQPAVHPRLVAGVILWGIMRGIRSSRGLEEATRERVDFWWFLQRRSLDHSTIAKFRIRFEQELKSLTRQLSQRVVQGGCEQLQELILDGTRVRANSDRQGARTAEALKELIAACEKRLGEKLDRLAREDVEDVPPDTDPDLLKRQIEQLQAKLEKYEKALEVAHQRDEIKQKNLGPNATAVRVPVNDPDSTLMPNKEGGFAPNYTPVVAVEPESGAIVYGDVVEGFEEGQAVCPAVEEVQSALEQKPQRVLADSGFASGVNLEALEQQQVDVYMPTKTSAQKHPPAKRSRKISGKSYRVAEVN